jgi:hypothetical protein
LYGELEIGKVLGHGVRIADNGVRVIESLARTKNIAEEHDAFDNAFPRALDAQAHIAVVDIQPVSGPDELVKLRIGDGNALAEIADRRIIRAFGLGMSVLTHHPVA